MLELVLLYIPRGTCYLLLDFLLYNIILVHNAGIFVLHITRGTCYLLLDIGVYSFFNLIKSHAAD
jgi:hypothetical protein